MSAGVPGNKLTYLLMLLPAFNSQSISTGWRGGKDPEDDSRRRVSNASLNSIINDLAFIHHAAQAHRSHLLLDITHVCQCRCVVFVPSFCDLLDFWTNTFIYFHFPLIEILKIKCTVALRGNVRNAVLMDVLVHVTCAAPWPACCAAEAHTRHNTAGLEPGPRASSLLQTGPAC